MFIYLVVHCFLSCQSHFQAKNHGLYIVHGLILGFQKLFEIRIPSERDSEEELNYANFSFILPSSEELYNFMSVQNPLW